MQRSSVKNLSNWTLKLMKLLNEQLGSEKIVWNGTIFHLDLPLFKWKNLIFTTYIYVKKILNIW